MRQGGQSSRQHDYHLLLSIFVPYVAVLYSVTSWTFVLITFDVHRSVLLFPWCLCRSYTFPGLPFVIRTLTIYPRCTHSLKFIYTHTLLSYSLVLLILYYFSLLYSNFISITACSLFPLLPTFTPLNNPWSVSPHSFIHTPTMSPSRVAKSLSINILVQCLNAQRRADNRKSHTIGLSTMVIFSHLLCNVP